MTGPRIRAWAMASAAAVLAGCAPATRVILLPQPGGAPSAVEVRSERSSARLATPYQMADVARNGNVQIEQTTATAVQKRHGQLLAAQPGLIQRFTLYFMPGGSELTQESQAILAEVLALAAARPGGEVVIIGHTDRVGTVESNDALSLQRARAVRELVIGRGFPAARVDAVGRGEREPVVPTADEVDEPKNRRAEVVVR